MSTLIIKSIKCIKPSSGIDNATRAMFGTAGTALGAAAGFVGGPFALGMGAAGGATTGVTAVDWLDSMFSGTDDLYLKVGDNRIWPLDDKYESIKSQQMHQVNQKLPFDNKAKVELWEYDWGSSDDNMGAIDVDTTSMKSGEVYEDTLLVMHEGEGSAYEVSLRVEN